MYSAVHASPYDAVEIFQNTKCKIAMGIHCGTWALTSEAVDEPPEKLKEALKIKALARRNSSMYVPLVKVVTSEPLAAVQSCVVVSSLLSVQADGFTRDFLI